MLRLAKTDGAGAFQFPLPEPGAGRMPAVPGGSGRVPQGRIAAELALAPSADQPQEQEAGQVQWAQRGAPQVAEQLEPPPHWIEHVVPQPLRPPLPGSC